MGSIYEYKLQYIPGIGGRVPEFIIVHGIIPYVGSSESHFGYSYSGETGWSVIEYDTKEKFQSRVEQINSENPYTVVVEQSEDPGVPPVTRPFTPEELQKFIDDAWNKLSELYVILDNGVANDRYFNGYEIQHFGVNLNINEWDNRTVSPVTPSVVPDAYDVFWPVAPKLVKGKWVQQWDGRSFTSYELEQYKNQKKQAINSERYEQLNGGFYSSVFGKDIDSDERSRSNISTEVQNCIISVAKDEPTYDITWRVADDSYVTVTRDQFLEMNNELAEYTQLVYQDSWDRKAAVDAATTRVAIDGV